MKTSTNEVNVLNPTILCEIVYDGISKEQKQALLDQVNRMADRAEMNEEELKDLISIITE